MDLVQVLKNIAPLAHAWVDPDVGPLEDAALLRPPGGSSLVFTLDFITPNVDEPEAFGAIAATNALSDVYAMGGEPQVALVICGFPPERLPLDVLARILQGGRDQCAKAGCAIVGGHTMQDTELKYGLCVIGSVSPGLALTQTHGRVGDRLVLTKPLGLGVASAAIRKGRLGAFDLARAVALMTTLNRDAMQAALAAGVRAATDVTGFGLLGHLRNLGLGSGLAARVEARRVPLLEFAPALAAEGLVPGGSRRNLDYVTPHARFDESVDDVLRLLLADAQTSGGLLLAVAPDREAELIADLQRRGTPAAAAIGTLVAGEPGSLEIVG